MTATETETRCAVCHGLLGVGCNLDGPRPDCPRTQFLQQIDRESHWRITLTFRRFRWWPREWPLGERKQSYERRCTHAEVRVAIQAILDEGMPTADITTERLA